MDTNTADANLTQTSYKAAAGFVFQHDGWLIDIDAYYNHTDGLSTVSPVLGLLAGEHGFSRGSSTVKGIDVLLKKQWSDFNTWVNYSYGHATNLFLEVSENAFFAPNDIRHNISMVASYKWNKFQFSVNGSYHSGLPYSTPEIATIDDAEEGIDPIFLYYLDYDYNVNRLKPYVRVDLNINYRTGFKRDY